MSVTINGTTGVSLVQNGVLTDANMPSGSVIQVVSYEWAGTGSYNTNNATVATGLTASITPTSAANKIIVFGRIASAGSNAYEGGGFTLYRNSTSLNTATGGGTFNISLPAISPYSLGLTYDMLVVPFSFVDTPASTSSTTYTIYAFGVTGAYNVLINMGRNGSGHATSQITLMEVVA